MGWPLWCVSEEMLWLSRVVYSREVVSVGTLTRVNDAQEVGVNNRGRTIGFVKFSIRCSRCTWFGSWWGLFSC